MHLIRCVICATSKIRRSTDILSVGRRRIKRLEPRAIMALAWTSLIHFIRRRFDESATYKLGLSYSVCAWIHENGHLLAMQDFNEMTSAISCAIAIYQLCAALPDRLRKFCKILGFQFFQGIPWNWIFSGRLPGRISWKWVFHEIFIEFHFPIPHKSPWNLKFLKKFHGIPCPSTAQSSKVVPWNTFNPFA